MKMRGPGFGLLLLMAASGVAFLGYQATRPMQLSLSFYPFVGHDVLVLDDARYANPGGPGRFQVRDFRFFLSNIRLVGPSGHYAVPDSYHLVRFDNTNGRFVIDLGSVPRRGFQRIEFGIGVDAQANGSITLAGDLDPNSRMAWSWDVGYKFVLFEGRLVLDDARYPLVYHVGFDENYKIASFDLAETLAGPRRTGLDFRVDIMRMFNGVNTVDMSALSNVKFDRADARLLAANYVDMVTLCTADCGLPPSDIGAQSFADVQ